MMSASLHVMRYDEIRQHVREHFVDLLSKFKERVSVNGPIEGQRLDVLVTSQKVADEPLGDYLDVATADGGDALLSAFCERQGITDNLSTDARMLVQQELHKGYKSFLDEAIKFNASFNEFDLKSGAPVRPALLPAQVAPSSAATIIPFEEAVQRYMNEGKHAQSWVPKTTNEKRDALDLLGEITGNKSTASLSKADVGNIKDVLMGMPKNRKKNPATRNLDLAGMLKVTDAPVISPATVNGYLSNFQSFFDWAVKNGCANENIFSGVRLRQGARASTNARKAFSDNDLQKMFLHLTDNPDGLVRKDDMKWPTLIAMFTGARVNEVAQLHFSDIKKEGGVWYIDINDDGKKTLKSSASKRIVPLHRKLLELDLINFATERGKGLSPRLFPSFPYSEQNGYGRNVGRWFNDKFLPTLGLKEPGLVFHSLRHTMVTKLSQNDVEESIVKAIVGHEQIGVTQKSYFKAGYKLEQLKVAIDKFEF